MRPQIGADAGNTSRSPKKKPGRRRPGWRCAASPASDRLEEQAQAATRQSAHDGRSDRRLGCDHRRHHVLARAVQTGSPSESCKRRSSPMSVETEERLAILCDKALQTFGAKFCQRLVQRAGTRSGCWGQRRGFEGPRHQIVDARLRMAVRDRLERRLDPGIGIDAVQFASRDERSQT